MRILVASIVIVMIMSLCNAQVCGNDILETGEECELGGLGCLGCSCTEGYEPTLPISKSCQLASTTPYCDYTKGYWCVKDGTHDDYYYLCNLPESQGYGYCGYGYTCKADTGFYTDSNPCTLKYSVCGNQVVEYGEECDGGFGCNNSTCQCLPGYTQTNPVSRNCQLSCTVTSTCASNNFQCGTYFNGCENVNCGTCASGWTCTNYRCVQDVCIPRYTCASVGATCGYINNGCENIYCGTCSAGCTCVNNQCTTALCGNGVINGMEECDSGIGCSSNCQCMNGYTPNSPPTPNCAIDQTCVPTVSCSGRCGIIYNGCENVNCGGCTSGVCNNGYCSTQLTCASIGMECGFLYDPSTGITTDCGNCASTQECDLGKCVPRRFY